VVIVEDNDDVRETLELALQAEGYAVLGARNGREGLDVLSRAPRPCVVLLDLMMPVMNGWQMYRAVEERDLLPLASVIVTSATPEDAPPGARVLAKPLDLDVLVQALEDAFQPRSSALSVPP
jgi:CheY-like chemotaxis protein